MPQKAYRRVATVYAKNGTRVRVRAASDNGKIYNALDKLEKCLRVAAKINRIIRGTDAQRAKRSSKKAKKNNLVALKKVHYLKSGKPVRRTKK